MEIIWNPEEIKARSMSIVEEYAKKHSNNPLKKAVIKRVIHSTADPSLADNLIFSPAGLETGYRAITGGKDIYTDVNMLKSGINEKKLKANGGKVYCTIEMPEILTMAEENNITRAAASMYLAGEKLNDSIIAIGNSPTALFAVLDMIEKGKILPAFIVGIPVGFVGAAEAKELLSQRKGLPHVTLQGIRGGSSVAAAVINALIKFDGDLK